MQAAEAKKAAPVPVFKHTPRAALVPRDARHSNQRRFGPAKNCDADHPTDLVGSGACDAEPSRVDVEVYREARRQAAELRLELFGAFSARVLLTPAQLYDLAERLIDAAHDIETNPAAEASL
jgi:hypothetical protein